MADEKNWQTVEEFIKQYKPVDEALKELEELRTSTALTTGTPANKLPTIFDDDPVYGSLIKRNKETISIPVIIMVAIAFVLGGAFITNTLIGAIFAVFWPLAQISEATKIFDERTIITRENQHLIDTITPEKIIEERNEHPETTAQLTDLQIAKILAEKQGGIKTLWQKEFERKYVDPKFLELGQNPEFSLHHLQQSEFYKDYFNKLVTAGVKALARETSAEKWKDPATFYAENNANTLSHQKQESLAKVLTTIFKQLKNTLCKAFENNEQELFFDVTIIGYICFMADLFTPVNHLRTDFLEIYVYYIFEIEHAGAKVSDFYNISENNSITRNPEFMGMFTTAYNAFFSSLQSFYTAFKEPKDFINAYAQLLLHFLAENGLLDTQNAEDPVLINEVTRPTASILPLCERALDAHYLPAFYTSLPEGQ